MIITNLEKLRVGMVVSQEVIALNGQVILEAGTELNDSNIKFLTKNRIEFIEVEDTVRNRKYTEEEFKQIKAEIEQNTKNIFQDCFHDKYMRELYKTVCEMKFIEKLNG